MIHKKYVKNCFYELPSRELGRFFHAVKGSLPGADCMGVKPFSASRKHHQTECGIYYFIEDQNSRGQRMKD